MKALIPADVTNHADISRSEWRWVWTVTLIVLAVSCLPYMTAQVMAPPGHQFAGFLANPGDANTYLAKMRIGWSGFWQFHLLHTAEVQEGAYLYLYYLGLGHLARVTGLSLLMVYHGARVLGGLFMLLVVYKAVAHVTQDLFERRLAFWLIATSAGLGWLGILFGILPIDLWIAEAFVFFSLLINPHFPVAIGLMTVIIMNVVWPRSGIGSWLLIGAAGIGVSIVQPMTVVTVFAVLTVYLLVRWIQTGQLPVHQAALAVTAGLAAAPIMLYSLWVAVNNATIAMWSAQNITLTPSVVDLVLGFGVVGMLAGIGGVWIVQQRERVGLIMLCWSVVTLILVYLPVNLQRRFIIGLVIPLGVLASFGFNRWLAVKFHGLERRRLLLWTLSVNGVGTIFLLLTLFQSALLPQGQSTSFEFLFLTDDEAAAMQWLSTQEDQPVVLASISTGNLLPGRSGASVVLGHPMETLDARAKSADVDRFFRGEMQEDAWQRFRDQNRIQFLFVGPAERTMGGEAFERWRENHTDEFSPVFQQEEVTIYQVQPHDLEDE